MKRRDTLKTIALGSITAGALLQSCKPNPAEENHAEAHGEHQHAAPKGYEPDEHDKALLARQFFTPHEMATITVLANWIIPADDRSGNAEAAGVPAFIEFMAKDNPGFQTPLRGGLRWMDVQCLNRHEKAFIDCTPEQQTALLDEIAYPDTAKPEMSQGVSFFNLMRNLTASGFWSSEIGIQDMGYDGNRPYIWDGVPQDVLESLGLTDVG